MMRWLRFILSHSVFIAICAAALCYQTYLLLGIPIQHAIPAFVFFSTLGGYNFYWALSSWKFRKSGDIGSFIVTRFSNLLMLFIASVGMFYCMYRFQLLNYAIGVAVILTLLYSVPLWPIRSLLFLQKMGFMKTVLLAFTWTYTTIAIPLEGIPGIHWQALLLLFTARFFFMLMLCIIFDTRDVALDTIRSLNSLATVLSRASLNRLMYLSFGMYLAAGLLLRLKFTGPQQLLAFLVTGLVTFRIYQMSAKERGYYFYYFLVDGLMLFSAGASFLASIV